MAKLTLEDAASGYQANTTYNANNALIETELNSRVLYRDNPLGEPNQMENLLDMNSNRIINLPSATTGSEPATYSQLLAAAGFTSFAGTVVETFTATSGQTLFTITSATYTLGAANLSVYVNGVRQDPSEYTETSTTSFTFTSGLDAGDSVVAVINERAVGLDTIPASSTTITVNGVTTNVNSYLNSLHVTDYVQLRALDTTPLADGQPITVTDTGISGEGILRYSPAHGLSDNGGTIIVIDADWYWERIWHGSIYVTWFGAVADYDGITGTDNTAAIQNALDYGQTIQQTGSGTKTIGGRSKVVLPGGTYLVNSTLYIDQFFVDFEGEGFASLIGWTTISNTSFILEIGTQARTAGARADQCRIKNIRFGRHQSNPFQGTYDSGTFGSGSLYQFQNSCAGVKVNRSHAMSVLEDCTFVGLRLGILLEGCYLFNIRKCNFNYNDRHIQGVQDTVDNVSNNDQVIDGCIFGASVMNGGVWLSSFDGLRISHFDYENSSQLPFYFYQCRGLYMEHLYFENNNKYYNSGSLPSYIYSTTPFNTGIGDDVPSSYAGFNMVFDACQSVNLKNYLTSNSTVPGLGEVLNAFCQNPIRIQDLKISTTIATGEYYLQQWSTTETGFIVDGVQCSYLQKLLALDTPSKVTGSRVGGDTTKSIPRVWYVDFDTGDDDISLEDMTALNPLATVNLKALPEDDARTYEINITGTSATVILSRTHDCAKIKLIGDGVGTTDIGSLQIPTGCNFELSDATMTVLKQWNDGSHTSSTQGLSRCVGKFDTVNATFSDAVGFLQSITDSELYFDGCTITQNNAAAYSMIVATGNECWFKNHTIANAKRDEARDYGKIYYQTSTYTGTVPIVGSARIGLVTAI